MFDEIRMALNAADSIVQELRWTKDSAIKALEECDNQENLDAWDVENRRTLQIKLDMIRAIENLLHESVKTYL